MPVVHLAGNNEIRSERRLVSLGAESVVLDESNRILDLESNVGAIGRLARARSVPIGYYKDAEKSAGTFRVFDGVRYSVPGDWATVEVDGRLFWGVDALPMLAAFLRGDPWFAGPAWDVAGQPRPGIVR